MRTVFVNPSKRRSSKRRKSSAAPKRRRARRASAAPRLVVRAPARRKRRRNAGITPFVRSSNPAIWPNPRRRKLARRSNPMSQLTIKKIVSNTLANLGGAGIAVGLDHFATSKIENVYARNGARTGAAVLAGAFLPGSLGAATAGAMMFPVMKELADYFLNDSAVTEADLDLLGQDLGAMLDPNDLKSW